MEYIFAACHDNSRHGSGVLLLCRNYLLVNSVDCQTYYMSETSEIIGVGYHGLNILCVYIDYLEWVDIILIDSFTRFRAANSCHPIIIASDLDLMLMNVSCWAVPQFLLLVTPLFMSFVKYMDFLSWSRHS